MGVRRVLLAAVLVSAATLSAQSQPRRTTNLAALVAYPGYFHLRPITVVDAVSRAAGELRLSAGAASVRVLYSGNIPDGPSEIRGEFWDIGRMHADDPRLATYDLKTTFHIDPDAGWPQPGQVMAIVASAIAPAQPSIGSNIRTIVLSPSRYLDQKVTIVGQFAGRNLLGDLPDAPGRSPFDFVLRSADAAIWVTNLRPRGRDFDLSLETRVDTGRWVEVSGVLQQGRGLQWLNAEGSRVSLVSAPAENTQAEPQTPAAPAPPPEVVFSAPVQDETDVLQTAPVRIQLSRDIDQATLKGRVQVHYLDQEARDLGEPDTPIAVFTYQYLPATRALEIRFTDPLVRYRTIKVELLDGILGTDKQPMAPWTLTFRTAGAI